MTPEQWPAEAVAFAQKILDNGGFHSDVSSRVSRKFKIEVLSHQIGRAIKQGILRGYEQRDKTGRNAEIVAMRKKGFAIKVIAALFNIAETTCRAVLVANGLDIPKRRRPNLKAEDEFAHLYGEDEFKDEGVTLLDLEPCHCRWPVARWPADYPVQRFCGRERKKEGEEFASSYCALHDDIAHGGGAFAVAAE